MSNPSPSAPAVSKLLHQIATDILQAPTEDLQLLLTEERGLHSPDSQLLATKQKMTECLDELQFLTSLGHSDSIEFLIQVGNSIASKVSELTAPTSPNPQDSQSVNNHWKTSIIDTIKSLDAIPQKDFTAGAKGALRNFNNSTQVPVIAPLLQWDYRDIITQGPRKDIGDYCESLIQSRLDYLRYNAAFTISQKSTLWPISLSAYPEHREHDIPRILEQTKLGLSTDIVTNITNKKGANRDLSEGSIYRLAEELYLELDKHRKISGSDEQLAEYRQLESSNTGTYTIPPWCIPGPKDLTKIGKSTQPTGWNCANIWRRKAALLPPLSKDLATQKSWVEASVSLLDSWVIERHGIDLQMIPDKVIPSYASTHWAIDNGNPVLQGAKKNRENQWSKNHQPKKLSSHLRSALKGCLKPKFKALVR